MQLCGQLTLLEVAHGCWQLLEAGNAAHNTAVEQGCQLGAGLAHHRLHTIKQRCQLLCQEAVDLINHLEGWTVNTGCRRESSGDMYTFSGTEGVTHVSAGCIV